MSATSTGKAEQETGGRISTPHPTIEQRIEAILFATNSPIDAIQLTELLDATLIEVQDAIRRLQKTYQMRSTALEVRESRKGRNPAFLLEVREEFRSDVNRLLPPPLDPVLAETLLLVALNQPVTQARLVREHGSRVYDQLRELRERGLVARVKHGCSYVLRTTEQFAAMYGVENEPERIRERLVLALQEDGSAPSQEMIARAGTLRAEGIDLASLPTSERTETAGVAEVVAASPEAATEAATATVTGTEAATVTGTEAEAVTEAETVAETATETVAETATETETVAESVTETETVAETVTETETETETD